MSSETTRPSRFDATLRAYEERFAKAKAMGGPEKLARRKAAGVLDARERIAYLCDPGSFIESGLFGTSGTFPADHDKTPADGKIAGFGKIDQREAGLVANDFTVAEIKKLDAGLWRDAQFAGAQVPTWDEMLARIRDSRHVILSGGRFCMSWERAADIAERATPFLRG